MIEKSNVTPVLKYRQQWQWEHLAFLKPHVKNKGAVTIMTKVSICKDGYERVLI